eukprot:jgi/Bigna1/87694/estExt_fgenesh1_pg.C_230067
MAADEFKAMPDGSGPAPPRLMIKKMVLENFKSYYGKRVIGPFHKCFSSIVGPNGSGKSNVIDSLLFVFGKRASKIRLKKISELIHRSSKHKDLPECRVSVHFHEIIDIEGKPDGFDVVPGSEFVVSRTANKESKSKYYINEKTSSFTEVTTLLKKKGVDLDNNRFLILQGEVEQISMMKPKALTPHEDGLLEYLEDIIGSNQYVEAIEEKQKEVEALNDVRQEKLNRVKIVEKEKGNLEGAKAEAEAYLLKENEANILRAKLYQSNETESKRQIAAVEEKKTRLNTKLDYERKKLEDRTTELKDIEDEYNKAKKDYDLTNKTMLKTKAEFAAYERKDIQFQENKKNEKAKKRKLEGKIKREKRKLDQLTQQSEDETKQKPKIEKEIEKLSKAKKQEDAVLEEVFEEVKGKTEHLRVKMEAKEKELVPLRKKINDIQKEKTIAESEQKLLTNKTEKATKQYEEAKESKQRIQKDISACTSALKSTKLRCDNIKTKLKSKKSRMQTVDAELASHSKKYHAARSKFSEAKAQSSRERSQGTVLKGLMKAKQRGLIPGIEGRLGDLGAIDAKYDVAISTACGALNHIVVDTTKTAERCVRLLRKENLGRATFLILEKQSGLIDIMRRPVKPPLGVKRLFDLVRPQDEKYKPAFYYALRDTLVATNLDQAVKIGYDKRRRWRVVTLAGELIDTSGTMSGGGNKVARGGMKASCSQQYSAAAVKDMEKDLHFLGKSISKAKEESLDFKNVSIVANYIKERTKNAQFVIISLRNNMFELADRLVGIYKTDDVTKSITIDPRNFSVPAGLQSKTNPAMLKQKKVASQMKLDGVVSSASK